MTDSSVLGTLRLLDAKPTRSQREVAHELGMSVGAANHLLRALLAKGLLTVGNFRSSTHKRGYTYLLTPEGVAAKAQLTRAFLARKIAEYDELRAEIEQLRAETETSADRGLV